MPGSATGKQLCFPIGWTVEVLLDPANFARYRSNAAVMNNRAVFEIPGMLGWPAQDFPQHASEAVILSAAKDLLFFAPRDKVGQ